MRTFLLVWLLLATMLAPAVCAAPAASIPPGNLSDSQIEQDLRARIARSKLASQKFQVRVQGGVATLDGRTGVVQHKGIMTRMAKAAGARSVVNRIEITEAARQRAAANLDAGRRKAVVVKQAAKVP
jgi:hypothetical protein